MKDEIQTPNSTLDTRRSSFVIRHSSFDINPVLIKELRGRMRGPRAYLFLSGTLALLAMVCYGLYRLSRAAVQSFGGGPPSAIIGQGMFGGLVFLVLLVICAIAPSLTAGAISGEHERKTFDMLMATPLRPASVLFGKLAASLSYAVLIILAAVPLVSLSYVFGGVAAIDMLQALLLLLGFALTFSVMGLFFSTLFRRTGPATVTTYVVLAILGFGSLFIYVIVGTVRQQMPPTWLLALNPFSAMASALVNPTPSGFMGGGISSLLLTLSGIGVDPRMAGTMPVWRYTVCIYAWLTVTLYLASTQLVKPIRRFRWSARGWIGAATFVAVSVLAVPVAFGPWTPERIIAWARWNTSPKRALVVNGKFTEALSPAWSMSAEKERSDEPDGEATLTADGNRPVVSLSRAGRGHAEVAITQEISQSAPSNGWLQVRVVLRAQDHDVPVCGVAGSECPVMVKLIYEGHDSGEYEWVQGFYASGAPGSAAPPICETCASKQPHIRVKPGQWFTFESPNLMQDLPSHGFASPRLVRSITVSAAGHSFSAQVAEVALLVRQGQPPDLPAIWATPTPALMMMAPTAVPMRMVPPPPPMPTATLLPMQTATPPNMPTFTPWPIPTASATGLRSGARPTITPWPTPTASATIAPVRP